MSERTYWGDCRDDANFGKPFTKVELDRIRALQAARMRFATQALPLHSSTGADGRWLATVDALALERDALRAALDKWIGVQIKCPKCGSPDRRARYCGNEDHATIHPVNSPDHPSRCTYCDNSEWHTSPDSI